MDDQKFARITASPNCVTPSCVFPALHGTDLKSGELTTPFSGVTPSTISVVASRMWPSGKIRRYGMITVGMVVVFPWDGSEPTTENGYSTSSVWKELVQWGIARPASCAGAVLVAGLASGRSAALLAPVFGIRRLMWTKPLLTFLMRSE